METPARHLGMMDTIAVLPQQRSLHNLISEGLTYKHEAVLVINGTWHVIHLAMANC